MNSPHFSGVLTAMVTPFRQRRIDWDSLLTLTEWQIDCGVQGLVPVGTTGESPTLSHEEHMQVVEAVLDKVSGRLPVVAGTGSNSTREAVRLTQRAHQLGADAVLQVTPYYNKPSQEGLFQHFSAVAEETDKPIVLYSIPSRCVIEIAIDTLVRLRNKYPHVNVIKEAGGSCDRVMEIRAALGDDMTILSGDDSLTLPFMALGGKGVISVASNLYPREVVAMVSATLREDFATAANLNRVFHPLFLNLFVEPNPVPVKWAMKEAGLIASDDVRRPLCSMLYENQALIRSTVQSLNRKLTS